MSILRGDRRIADMNPETTLEPESGVSTSIQESVEEVAPTGESSVKPLLQQANTDFIVERRRPSFFEPLIYSIRPAVLESPVPPDDTQLGGKQESIQSPNFPGYVLFAQIQLAKMNQYVISGDISDLSKARRRRSKLFVGKLKVEFEGRVYTGFKQNPENSDRSHLVSIIYDHERKASVDLKMEVCIPLHPTSNFHDAFMSVYRDGTQNMSQADDLLIMVQRDDSVKMAAESSLTDLDGAARVVSTKNFSLVKARALRKSRVEADIPKIIKEGDDKVGTTSKETDQGCEQPDENIVYMQFGKISDDTFSCRFKDPLTLSAAFMIILSRFDTRQSFI